LAIPSRLARDVARGVIARNAPSDASASGFAQSGAAKLLAINGHWLALAETLHPTSGVALHFSCPTTLSSKSSLLSP